VLSSTSVVSSAIIFVLLSGCRYRDAGMGGGWFLD